MKTFTVGAFVLSASLAGAAAQGLPIKDLPAGVQSTIKQEEAKGGKIKNISKETEDGKTVYEVETMVGQRSRDLIVDTAGNIVLAEDETSIDDVPAPVKAAFTAGGKVLKVERLTRGTVVTYEAQIEAKGKKSEMAVDASGKRVKG